MGMPTQIYHEVMVKINIIYSLSTNILGYIEYVPMMQDSMREMKENLWVQGYSLCQVIFPISSHVPMSTSRR